VPATFSPPHLAMIHDVFTLTEAEVDEVHVLATSRR
jgi:hypothetical protein